MKKWDYFKAITNLVFHKKKKWELQTGHTVEIAFYSGGKPYYKLSDLFNTFTERGLDAYQVYEEVSMRIDKKDLQVFVDKIKDSLNKNPIQLIEITKLITLLEERISLVIAPRELIWKMGSVAYFDESESPYTYDSLYAQKKIALWKKNGDVDDFFLFQQLSSLMPLPELSKETYHQLQETISKILKHQQKSISGNHLPKGEEISSPSV